MRLLIVGTLLGYITEAGRIALDRGAKVAHAETIDQALHALRNGKGADLVMVDVKLDVAKLVEALKAERIALPVVACGIGTDTQAAVRAIRAGAKEYLPLPPDAQLIAAVLEAVSEETHALVFRDPAMKTVLKLADQIAPADATVLITGESGTGKEVVARWIHRKSRSIAPPFPKRCSKANCSATRKAPSRVPSRAASASSKKPAAAPCCWTRSARSRRACRPSCCAPSRNARSTGSGAAAR
jgi:DNA-binding NtrC family response regulator